MIINSTSTKHWLTFSINKELIERFILLAKQKNSFLKNLSPNIIYADMVSGGEGLTALVASHQLLTNHKQDVYIDSYQIDELGLKEIKVSDISISITPEQGEKVCRLIGDKFGIKDVDDLLIKKAIKRSVEFVYAVATNQIDDNFYLNPLLIEIANQLNKGTFSEPLSTGAMASLLSFGLSKKSNGIFFDHAALEDISNAITFRFNQQKQESEKLQTRQALWLVLNDNSFKRLAYLYKSYLVSGPMFSAHPTGHEGLAGRSAKLLRDEIDFVVDHFTSVQPDAHLKIAKNFEYFGGAYISIESEKIEAAANKIAYDEKLGFSLEEKIRNNPKQYFDVICENLPSTVFKRDRVTRVLIQTDAF